MKKFLVTGGSGQLAGAFVNRLDRSSADFLAPSRSELDITDRDSLGRILGEFAPDVILNCAAYNMVDRAEDEPGAAMAANAAGPQALARAASEAGARLVHFSTDYVFDGRKQDGLYNEEDPASPINEYGRSKLRGEELVRGESDNCLVFRVSWLYGRGTQNFIHKLLGWASEKEYLSVACDEFSVPTCTHTVADVALRAIESGLPGGLYHLTSGGYCSRHEWARLALRLSGIDKFVRPVSMDDFDSAASRPGFSAMSNRRLSGALGISIPDWEEALRDFIKEEDR